MNLAHPKKGFIGKWEVAWMWLPFFLASDRKLHKDVDRGLTELFRGNPMEPNDPVYMDSLGLRIHTEVVKLITKKYPIPGLEDLLNQYLKIDPASQELVPEVEL